jgi:hypothetical protein
MFAIKLGDLGYLAAQGQTDQDTVLDGFFVGNW